MVERPAAGRPTIGRSAARAPLADRILRVSALLPPLFLAAVVLSTHVEFTFGDEALLARWIVRWEEGRLTLADVAAPFHGHSHLLPLCLLVALGGPSEWNLLLPKGGTLLLAGAASLVLFRLWRDAERREGLPPSSPPLAALSVLFFSFAPWENWMHGWQISITLCVTAAVLGLSLLSAPRLGISAMALSIAMGVVAVFSFAAGIAFFAAAAAACAVRRARAAALFFLSAGLLAFIWLRLGPASGGIPLPPSGGQGIVAVALFAFSVLGSPVVHHPSDGSYSLAIPLGGIAGCSIVVAGALRLIRARTGREILLAPWIGFAVFSMTSAVLVAGGRWILGPAWALQSRYASLGVPLWLAALAMLALWSRLGLRRSRGAVWAAVLITAAAAERSASTLPLYFEHARNLRLGAALEAAQGASPDGAAGTPLRLLQRYRRTG